MKKEVIKSLILSDKTAWIGVGLGLLFWFVESAIHSLVLHEGTFIRHLLSPAAHEAWMRSVVVLMFIGFGLFAQFIISRLHEGEQTIKSAYTELKQIFESASSGMLIIDKDFVIRHTNQAYLSLVGLSRDEVLGKRCYEILPSAECHGPKCALKRIMAGEVLIDEETKLSHSDGTDIHCITTAVPLFGSEGKITGIIKNFKNIAHLKEAKKELQESRTFLEDIFNAIQDGISILDCDFNIIQVNAWIERMYASKTPLPGKKCYVVYQQREYPCPWCPTIRSIRTGQVHKETVPYPSAERPTGWIELSAFPLKDANGSLTGIIEYAKDVSDRKNVEEELKNHQIGLEKLFKGRTVELMLSNEKLKQEIMERKQAEEKLAEKAGELEEMNEQLKQNQAQLVQSEKMASIGQLAAGVAHEINNPVGFINCNLTTLDEYRRDLTALINNYLELEQLATKNPALSNNHDLVSTLETIRNLKEKMDIDFVLGDFDKVIAESREGTDRIKKIVQALKDFSHVDQAELKWANLNKGLESTLNIVWNEIKYKATVKKDYGDIPEVYCYPQQINQVFMNILVNAAQAIEDKGEIKISTAYIDGAEPMVEVRMSDTGKGIPPENLTKIFGPFFTTKPVGKGTGLGLSMAYGIIKKHDGEIKVESEVGKGTTFVIRLPVEGTKEGEEKTQ